MHMICPSVPIPASTELTDFWYISCRQKLPHSSFATPSLLAPGGMRTSYFKHTFKFGLLRSCYAIDITYKMKFKFAECIQCHIVTK